MIFKCCRKVFQIALLHILHVAGEKDNNFYLGVASSRNILSNLIIVMTSNDDSSNFSEDEDSSLSSADDEDSKDRGEVKKCEFDEVEDSVVQAIKLAQERKVLDHPPDIKLTDVPSDICFHPTEDLIAISTYSGDTEIYSYTNEGNTKLKSVRNEGLNSRDLKYNQSGDKLYILTNNESLIVCHSEGLQIERTISNTSTAPGTSLCIIDENVIGIGDEDGYVQAWDKRMDGLAFSLKVSEDSVSSMISDEHGRVLVCSSTDGTISSIKVRAKKIQTQSESYESDFNCMGTLKQNTKLAVGDSSGKVYLFNWGEFGYHSDVYPGHTEAINSMIPITEKIILTGGDDGFIRAVHFFPMKFIGIVGKHNNPVESLDVCNDGHLIASTSHDETVKFWNVNYFEDFVMPSGVKISTKATKSKDMKHNLPSSRQANAKDFFSGLKD